MQKGENARPYESTFSFVVTVCTTVQDVFLNVAALHPGTRHL